MEDERNPGTNKSWAKKKRHKDKGRNPQKRTSRKKISLGLCMPFRPCIHSFFFLPFPEFDSVLFQKYSSPQKARARDEELHLSW